MAIGRRIISMGLASVAALDHFALEPTWSWIVVDSLVDTAGAGQCPIPTEGT